MQMVSMYFMSVRLMDTPTLQQSAQRCRTLETSFVFNDSSGPLQPNAMSVAPATWAGGK